jgi:hypothetical protein
MKKLVISRIIRAAAAGVVLLLPILAWADTARLASDAFVNPGDGTNYGALPTVNIGGAAASSGLLLFDLSTLPSPTSVAWARLHFYVDKVNAAGALDLGTASASWTEATVTGTSGITLGSPLAIGIAISAAGYVTIDVSAQVVAWLNGSPNNGFILSADAGTPNLSIFIDSKENSATSHPAVLEVVFNGTAGAAGPSGAAGLSGAVGAPGLAGAAGATGPTGPFGPSGATGAVGLAGPAGATGATGPVGPTGASGAAGAAGLAGAAGATGPTGAVGASGPSGAAGLAGAQGPAGATGAPGLTGPAGPTGPAFSNTFSVNPGTGTYIISNTNPDSIFFTTSGSTVTMPLASSLTGKKIWIVLTNPGGGNSFTVSRQSADLLYDFGSNGAITLTFQDAVQFYSDGTRWNAAYTNQ